jgi:hypothetical protein
VPLAIVGEVLFSVIVDVPVDAAILVAIVCNTDPDVMSVISATLTPPTSGRSVKLYDPNTGVDIYVDTFYLIY